MDLHFSTNGVKNIKRSDEEISTFSKQIIKKQKSNYEAFFLCNIEEILRKYSEWTTIFPKIKPFYAVKCNDNKTVLKTLSQLGTGFDCASEAEIKNLINLGVEPHRIIYANPTKQESHIKTARRLKVDLMTFDNAYELNKIKKIYPNARLILRIRSDAKEAKYVLGAKFGATLEETSCLLELAHKLDLKVIGVSFHVGSGCKEPEAFERAIRDSHAVFQIAKNHGYNFKILDIGGGFPGELGTSLQPFGEVINKALQKYFSNEPEVEVIAEPGSFFVSSAFSLIAQIHSVREIKDNFGSTKSFMYYINEGVYGSFFDCVLGDHETIKPNPLRELKDGEKMYPAIIWGASCDSNDKVSSNALLPKMEIGDWLIFKDMGDYSFVIRSKFNGFPVSKIYFFGTKRDKIKSYSTYNIIS